MTRHFSIQLLAVLLFLCPAAASDERTASMVPPKADPSDAGFSFNTWQTTVIQSRTDQRTQSKPLSIGKKQQNIAALRAQALQISMEHLPRLRPYASNYPRMVQVVRAYWRQNAANPSASRLTKIILQHVHEKYRFFVRSKLHTGIDKGISVLKRKLRKS